MVDISDVVVQKGIVIVVGSFDCFIKKEKLIEVDKVVVFVCIQGLMLYDDFKCVDFVIEVVIENFDLKVKIFKQFEVVVVLYVIVVLNILLILIIKLVVVL